MTTTPNQSDTVIQITHDGMGKADQELQHKLIKTYFKLLAENEYLPAAICFYTDGVKLTTAGSPVLTELENLASKGVRLIICNTCLKHFKLQDEVQVGIVGGMTDIIEAQWRAAKIITL